MGPAQPRLGTSAATNPLTPDDVSDATDTHIAAGDGYTVSGALAALAPQGAPSELSADDCGPLDPPF